MNFKFKIRYTYRCNSAISGSGPAIMEFNNYKQELEKATGKKVYMVKSYSFLSYERISYIMEDKKQELVEKHE